MNIYLERFKYNEIKNNAVNFAIFPVFVTSRISNASCLLSDGGKAGNYKIQNKNCKYCMNISSQETKREFGVKWPDMAPTNG